MPKPKEMSEGTDMSEKVSHTSEPWRYSDPSEIFGAIWAGDRVAIADVSVNLLSCDVQRANGRRIVACVNACKGIELQTLEAAALRGGIGALKVLADNLELRQQRDQLAAALQVLMRHLPDSQHPSNEDCWSWCWNELNDDAQEAVKEARLQAHLLLASLKEQEHG